GGRPEGAGGRAPGGGGHRTRGPRSRRDHRAPTHRRCPGARGVEGRAVSSTLPTGRDVVVRIEGLHKSFGHLEVLRGIDMEVHKGEVVVIFGRSGSGKSTLLRCVNFLEDPTSGTIE